MAESDNCDSIKDRIRREVMDHSKRHSPHSKIRLPFRTGSLGDRFEERLYTIVKLGGRDLVRCEVDVARRRYGRNLLSSEIEEISYLTFSWLKKLWFDAGDFDLSVEVQAQEGSDPRESTLLRLENAVHDEAQAAARDLTNAKQTGLLVPGTEADRQVRELFEARRKAEEADPESRRRRQERDAYLTARLAKILGKKPAERWAILDKLDRQEELLRDARDYAAIIYLSEPRSPEARRKVTQRIWDEFIPKHKDKDAFNMGFRDLHAAIWPADDPSLEEVANKAGEDESVATGTRPVLSGAEGGAILGALTKGDTRDPHLKQRLAAAIEVFERQQGYEKAQVWLSKRMEKVCKAAGPESSLPIGSPARAELVLKLFAVRARAYLRLVSNIEAQNAFVVMLALFEILAWEEFVGGYPSAIREGAPSIDQEIGERKRLWIRKGYERLEAHALDKRRSVGSKTSRVTAPVPIAEEIGAAQPSAPLAAGNGYTRPGGHPAVRKGDSTKPFHMRLRSARAKAKLSRTGTVQKLKVKGIQITADAIKKHEEGVAMPRPDVRRAYALIYELTEDQLFSPGE
jgi:hypothetical protein